MLELYHAPRACSLAVACLLRQLDVPFTLHRVDLQQGEQRTPAFLRLNPLGQVPVLVDGEQVLTQVGAILNYLVRGHGAATLSPLANAQQAEVERWQGFFSSTLHPQFALVWRPERFCDDEAAWPAIRATGLKKLAASFADLDTHLADRDYYAADTLTQADFYALPLTTWAGRLLPEQLRPYPHVSAHLDRMLALPSVQAILAETGLSREALLAP